MSRKFIAGITAAAIAVSALSASQAQADVRKRNLVLGAITLGIIGAAIANENKGTRGQVSTRNYDPQPRHNQYGHNSQGHSHGQKHGHKYGHGNGNRHGNQGHVRPIPGRVLAAELPRGCQFDIGTRRGSVRLFEQGCVNRNYSRANQLPQHCLETVRIGADRVTGYSAQCIRNSDGQTRWVTRR